MGTQKLNVKDLNLLVVFDRLYIEQSVTRAAQSLHITQSAVSQSLKKLQDQFREPLFIRSAGGMEPTAYAESIYPHVRDLLDKAEYIFFSQAEFEPETADNDFTIGVPEYVGFPVFENVYEKLADAAPNVRINTLNTSRYSGSLDLLENRDVDLLIGNYDKLDKTLNYEEIYTEKYVCAYRKSHPLENNITQQAYFEAKHVGVSLSGRKKGMLDEYLARDGKSRDIHMTTSQYWLGMKAVEQTNMILTEPERVVRLMKPYFNVHVVPLPFDSPPFHIKMVWHRYTDGSPAHIWLRNFVGGLIKCDVA